MELELPHRGEKDLRVRGMHDDIDATGVAIDEEDALPRRATVGRPIDPAFFLRSVAVSLRRDEDDVRVIRIDRDSTDPSRRVEAHLLPRTPRVRGLVDAIADRDVAANPWLTGSRPDDVVIRRRDGQGADGGDILIVEDRRPVNPRIDGLPNSAGCRTGVVDVRIAGHAND